MIEINNRKVSGSDDYARYSEQIPEDIFFLTGVIFFFLPELMSYAGGGLVPLTVFAGSVLVGAVAGLTKFYNSSPRKMTSISTGAIPPAPTIMGRVTTEKGGLLKKKDLVLTKEAWRACHGL